MARFAGPRRAYETGEHKPPVSLKRLVLTGLACPGRRRRLVGSLPLPPSSDCPPRVSAILCASAVNSVSSVYSETRYVRSLTSVRPREERQDAREYRRAVWTR